MRAIDADKIKAIFQDPLYHSTIKDYGEVMKCTFVMDVIDQAPTVETSGAGAIQIVYDDSRYIDGYRDGRLDACHAHTDEMKRLKAENNRLSAELEKAYETIGTYKANEARLPITNENAEKES